MANFFSSVMEAVRDAVVRRYEGNVSRASRDWGIQGDNLHKWLRGDRTPSLEKISPILDKLGIALSTPGESGRDVCFVQAQTVSAEADSEPPGAEDYIAAPLVGESGAGPGYLPQEEIRSWFLVYRNLAAVRYRRNLIAVEIGRTSTSMRPTLNPQDIVLIDRDDRDVSRPGHMMLVLDPQDGSGMIKRVAVQRLDSGDYRITYYSDNAVENPPQVYSLREDFLGDWDRSVVGRVIWAWSDVREK